MNLDAAIAIGAVSVFTVGFAALASLVLSRVNWLGDAPNARSSHMRTTPRSGGFAVFGAWICAFLVAAAAQATAGPVDDRLRFAAIAALAFLFGAADDIRPIPSLLKLVIQIGIASLFAWQFGGLVAAPIPFVGAVDLGAFAGPVAVFWIVAFMNAYNFMDGINGIAAACGALGLAALALAAASVGSDLAATAALLTALALTGFLPVNFPSGRIFMGDGGSQSVGFLIAAIGVIVANDGQGRVTTLLAPIAFLPFLFDVAFTLLARARRGAPIFSAHREHLYQLLVRLGWTHAMATSLYLALSAATTAMALSMTGLAPTLQIGLALLPCLIAIPAALRLRAIASRAGLIEADRTFAQFERDTDKSASSASAAE